MYRETKEKISAWVEENREFLVEELKEFLRIPNLTGYEGPAQEFMKAQYEKLGLDVDVLGKPMAIGSMSACDARHLGNRGNTPCLVCGPGTGPAHAVNEFIDLEVYLDYIKLLALTVCNWCG